jgi:hypothetical protein
MVDAGEGVGCWEVKLNLSGLSKWWLVSEVDHVCAMDFWRLLYLPSKVEKVDGDDERRTKR